MNFFEHQRKAKSNSTKLIFLFLLAVLILIFTTYFSLQWLIDYNAKGFFVHDHPIIWSYKLFAVTTIGTLLVIVSGCLYKIHALSEGGHAIAHMMQGRLIEHPGRNLKEKQLLNVVDEMALASGIPSPNVYVLDHESTINAFAAGYTVSDAVLGVTQGSVDQLTREELQGVIGHEFSHILNGDMRLNIRLIGLLHGILVIALIGRILLGSRRSSSSNQNRKGGGGLILIGLALLIIGWVGHFFGKLIQAAVSRQREFLADASAVQFTRNTDGIGNALKKIGGYLGMPPSGSFLSLANKQQIAHMTFASVNFSELLDWSSTHPKIEKRIQAIDPSFDPKREKKMPPLPKSAMTHVWQGSQPEQQRTMRIDNMEIPVSKKTRYTQGMISSLVGTTPTQAIERQSQWLAHLPTVIESACRHTIKARAVIYALLGEYDDATFEKFKKFLDVRDPHTVETLENIWQPLKILGNQSRLELIDLSIPALRKLSPDECKMFFQNISEMINFDQKIGIFDFILVKIIKKHLKIHKNPKNFPKETIDNPSKIKNELVVVLSMVAHTSDESDQANLLFQEASSLFFKDASIIPLSKISIAKLNESIKKLFFTNLALRQKILEACAHMVLSDKSVTWKEREMLRAIGDALDCPIPPLCEGSI